MDSPWLIGFLILSSYLLGSIPFGVVVSRLLGTVDPRTAGSRNVGFTNVLRVSGKKAGILTSRMGKGGGYYLLKDPKDIRLADVIRMFSGAIALLPCVSLNYYEPCAECEDEAKCGLNKIMMQVRVDTLKILATKTLRDILKAEG